jgi:hypothetical protein
LPAERFTKKANTPAKKRQWAHVEESAKARGESPGAAVRMANSVIKHHAAKGKRTHEHRAERKRDMDKWAEGK